MTGRDGAGGTRRDDDRDAGDDGERGAAGDADPDERDAEGDDADAAAGVTSEVPVLDAPSIDAADRAALARNDPWSAADRVALPGALAVAAALTLVDGLVGVAGAAIVLALWAVAPAYYAGAAGAACYAAVTGGRIVPEPVDAPTAFVVDGTAGLAVAGLAVAGVAWQVAAPLSRDDAPLGVLLGVGGALLLVVGAVRAGRRLGELVGGAAVLVVAVGGALYLLHRYALVAVATGDRP